MLIISAIAKALYCGLAFLLLGGWIVDRKGEQGR
jgi:hypothetical protein